MNCFERWPGRWGCASRRRRRAQPALGWAAGSAAQSRARPAQMRHGPGVPARPRAGVRTESPAAPAAAALAEAAVATAAARAAAATVAQRLHVSGPLRRGGVPRAQVSRGRTQTLGIFDPDFKNPPFLGFMLSSSTPISAKSHTDLIDRQHGAAGACGSGLLRVWDAGVHHSPGRTARRVYQWAQHVAWRRGLQRREHGVTAAYYLTLDAAARAGQGLRNYPRGRGAPQAERRPPGHPSQTDRQIPPGRVS